MMNTMLKKLKKISGKEVNKMRKLIIMLGLVSMVIAPRLSWAQVDVTVQPAAGDPGQTITVPVTLSETTGLGIYGCDLELLYNPTLLSLTDVQDGILTGSWEAEVEPADTDYDGVMDGWEMKTYDSLTTVSALDIPSLPAEAIWDYPVYMVDGVETEIAIYGRSELAGQGAIANLLFQVNPTASAGTTFLVLKRGDLSEETIPVSLYAGTFDISGGGGLEGDVNDDGSVNIFDVQACVNVILRRDTRPDWVARADVNGDLLVDVTDLARIVNIVLYLL